MTVLAVLTIIICITATAAEMARTLMMVQQNSYRPERYRRYLSASKETTSTPHLLGWAVLFASAVSGMPAWLSLAMMAVYSGVMAARLLRARYKKPLAWTPRARRIYETMWFLPVIIAVICMCSGHWTPAIIAQIMLLAFCSTPALAIAALYCLKPVENAINRRYIDDAASILRSMPELKVIGITGSYGKTSTKHYLYRILSEQYSVCMTPGSYNTTLGVVRTIREHLKPYNSIFICEMGAKQPGDIKEICDLVHPSIGIVTAVGPQHLESFKTIENVQRTKFELIDSLPADGLAVINDDFPPIASRQVSNVATVRYGVKPRPEVNFAVGEIEYSASGTGFTVITPDGDIKLHTRLVGECNVSNLVAAVIVAMHLGVSTERIAYAVEKIEQVEHRLNVKRTPGGLTIIDDAFNSNPTGSGMAVDVLAAMTGGRRIIITPGMIELGAEQEELNRRFGMKISEGADIAIIVGRYNREAIVSGIGDAEGIEVHTVDTFADAQRLLTSMARPGDTVLYENDLPDTFK